MARNPKHPGALHYWIHVWEPTKTPERAEAAADALLPLMPAAGHMVLIRRIIQQFGPGRDMGGVQADHAQLEIGGGQGHGGQHS